MAARRVIDDATGCWLWEGARTGSGNGQCRFRGRTYTAHRLAAFAWHGYPLDGPAASAGDVGHADGCAASCFNPEHLLLGVTRGYRARGEGNGRARMSEATARQVVAACRRGVELDHEIAARLGTTPRMVANVRAGLAWAYLQEEYP